MQNVINFFGKKRYIPIKIPANVQDTLSFPVEWKKGNPPYIASFDEMNTIYSGIRFNGVGMILDDLVCFDIDIKRHEDGAVRKNGFPLFNQWKEDHDLDFSEYYCEKTRSGGAHYYFHNDLNMKFTKEYGDIGIDFLTDENHLVVIAGSHGYSIEQEGVIGNISDLPRDFLEIIGFKKPETHPQSVAVEQDDIDFKELVNVISFINEKNPAKFDKRDDWSKLNLFLIEVLKEDDYIAFCEKHLNQDEWAKRNGSTPKSSIETILN
jgi:hypothetical protein